MHYITELHIVVSRLAVEYGSETWILRTQIGNDQRQHV
jgi:hypothetical protein